MSVSGVVETLARASLQGGLFVAAVWIVCRLFPRLPAALRCGLWWAACLKLLLGLAVLPAVSLALLPAPESVEIRNVAPARTLTSGPSPVPFLPPSPGEGKGMSMKEIGISGLAGLWTLGLLALSFKDVLQFRRTRRIVQAAEPVREGWVQKAFSEICERLALRREPALRGSGDVRTPQVTGLIEPVVLVPRSGLERLSPPEVSMTLCHELVHLRRRDLWLGWVPALAGRIFFFHPLAALAAREYAIAREAACDAEVIRVLGTAPQAYGRLLLRWGVAPRETGLAAAGASPSLQNLKRRLQMLQHSSENKRRSAAIWWLAGAAILAGLVPLRITAQEPAPEAPEAAPAPEAPAAPEAVPAPEAAPALEGEAAPEPPEAATPPTPPARPHRAPKATPEAIEDGVREGVPGGIEDGVRGGVPGALYAPRAGRPATLPTPAAAPRVGRPATLPTPAAAPRAGRPATLPTPAAAPKAVPPVAGAPLPARAPRAAAWPTPLPAPAAAPRAVPALPGVPGRPAMAPRAAAWPTPTPAPAVAPVAPVRIASARAVPPPPPPPAAAPAPPAPPKRSAYRYSTGDNGDSWVLLSGRNNTVMSGSTKDLEQVKRLRGDSDEPILWFRQGGKAYVVRDAATLDRIEKLWEPVNELGARQGELGGRQGRLGGQQGALGAKQGVLGAKQGALAAEQARQGDRADDRDFERRHRELSEQMEALGRQQEELGRQQEALGRQQEELGRQQEAASSRAEAQMKDLLNQAIRSGRAQEVR